MGDTEGLKEWQVFQRNNSMNGSVLSTRETIAMHLLAAVLANSNSRFSDFTDEEVVERMLRIADKLIAKSQ